ncbi:MAG: aldose 1-epimerase [bacterium]|nr:aldose 1-epimerase [bacterium]
MHTVEPEEVDGRSCVALHSPEGLVARFLPATGMVCASLEHHGEELLASGQGLDAYVSRGKLLGIPLLHPWANRLERDGFRFADLDVVFPPDEAQLVRDSGGLPIHGLVSGCPDWRVLESTGDATSARLAAELDFSADPGRAALFPFPHRLRIDAVLAGVSLTITTTLEATGTRDVPVAFGWHPYFVLPGVPRADWRVTLPLERQCILDDQCLPTGEFRSVEIPTGPLGDRTYDALFDRRIPGEPFVLEGGGRRIEVHFGEGYDVAVIYAPAQADVVCFEPMTEPTNPFAGETPPRAVASGEKFSAAFEIRVGATR